MRARASFSAWVVATLIAAGGVPVHAQPLSPNVEKEFVLALQRRQDAVKNVRVEWTSTRTETKGCRSARIRGTPLEQRVNPDGYDIPPSDVTYETQGLYCLEGKRIRVETENRDWSKDGKSTLTEIPAVLVLDGERSTDFHVYRTPDSERRQGGVVAEKSYSSTLLVSLLPITFAVRGVSADYCYLDTAAFRATGNKARIAGADCVEVRSGESQTTHHLWVDPARGYVVVRSAIAENGATTDQTDIAYATDPTLGWVPSGWKQTLVFAGKISSTDRFEVTEFLVNTKLPADQFSITFPERTRVNDEVNKRKWIVRPDGSARTIQPGEEWATDEQLLSTSPGAAPGANPRPAAPLWRRYWLTAVLAVLVGSLAALGVRAFVRRRTS